MKITNLNVWCLSRGTGRLVYHRRKILDAFSILGCHLLMMAALMAAPSAHAKIYPLDKNPYGKLGGDFTLTSHLGEPLSLKELKGKPVLLNFGYTSCPDICPMVLARLTQLERLLGAQAAKVQVLFISFDPARDSVSQLKNYLGFFSSNFIGMTGDAEQLAQVAKQFGAVFIEQKEQSAAGPLFSHSDFVYLLDENGVVRALYNNDSTIQEIKVDVLELLN